MSLTSLTCRWMGPCCKVVWDSILGAQGGRVQAEKALLLDSCCKLRDASAWLPLIPVHSLTFSGWLQFLQTKPDPDVGKKTTSCRCCSTMRRGAGSELLTRKVAATKDIVCLPRLPVL